jgi:transcription factor TFIIIB component B''
MYSSVVRKTAQPIKPNAKAIGRRNVRRVGQQPPAAATTSTSIPTLTPESNPQTPDLPSTSQVAQTGTTPTNDSSLKPSQPDVVPILTPPPTARETSSPGSVTADPPVISDVAPGPAPPAEGGVGAVPDISAPTPTTNSSTTTRRKRRAVVLDEQPIPTQAQAQVDQTSNASTPVRVPTPSSSPNKRRKGLPQANASYLLARTEQPQPRAQTSTPARDREQSTPEDRGRASTEDLLQQATSQARSVSVIADGIETNTRQLRPRSRQTSYAEAQDDTATPPTAATTRRKRTRAEAIADHAVAVIDDAVGTDTDTPTPPSKKRKRTPKKPKLSPEQAEAHKLDPAAVTMFSLTKDSGLGQRSETGRELDENWAEIKKRWDEGPEENRKKAYERAEADRKARKAIVLEDGEEAVGGTEILGAGTNNNFGPSAVLVDGVIVADPERNVVDFSANVAEKAVEQEEHALEVKKVYNYVNANRVGKWAGRHHRPRWGFEDSELFFKGLRMFGTDFEMIATLFPKRGRMDVKNKYTRELKEDRTRVEACLKEREDVDLDVYREMAMEDPFEVTDPQAFLAELHAQGLRALEEQKRSWDEGGDLNEDAEVQHEGADIPIPSTEMPDVEGEEGEVDIGDERARRIAAVADAAITRDLGPAKQKRTRRAKESAVSKGAAGSRGKKPKQTLEGVEEVVGSLR